MGEGKTRWGIWKEDTDWHRDSEGDPHISCNRQDVEELRDLMMRQNPGRDLQVRVHSVSTPEREPLWGLWYKGEHSQGWCLDIRGDPVFSPDRRLVAAHAVARRDNFGIEYSVRQVGDDGYPVGEEATATQAST